MRFTFPLLTLALSSPLLASVQFEIQYLDQQGTGFYDGTAATPEGGNTGTTLGEQRRIALEYAVAQFAASLHSTVPIHVEASFTSQGGSSAGAVLGSAGPEWLSFNFDQSLPENVAYPSALANKLSGQDFSDASQGIADIAIFFNSDIDGDTALGNITYYYGLDGTPPGLDVDFITVATHEVFHGLGVLSVIDPLTGFTFGADNPSESNNTLSDIYSTFLSRRTTTTQPLLSMTQEARLAATTAEGEVIWTGNAANTAASGASAGLLGGSMLIFTPRPASEAN